MMKKVIAWLLVLSLTAAISIGATLAYLTDTDEDVNVMTLGKVKIDQLEYERVNDETANEKAEVQEFHDNKPLYPAVTENGFDYTPGDTYVDWTQIGKDGYTTEIWNPEKINNELDKMVFIKNKGDYDAFVRTVFAFEAGNYKTLDQFKSMMHLNLNETDFTWTWVENPVTIGESTYFVATATYNKVLAPGALTEISLSQIALDKTATNADVEAFGDTYQVLVKSQGIQADGFENAADALDEGFGVITATNVPWDNDVPTKGITVRQALHYLDGDNTTTAITANVSSVTFGLNENYTSIVDANTGVLVDVEQDVPVYAYYVKNGSNYDVYFLADDDIYLPKDSATLFKGMTNLTSVETKNLNVSRAETMKQLFRECGKLTTVNTTGWDTSKVTDMSQMFYKCGKLTAIPGIGSWDTGAVTTMKAMFRQSGVTGELNLSAWDVSNVTNMNQLFYGCPNAFSLNAEGWDAGKVTDMGYMFTSASKMQSVNANGWDTSAVTNMYAMFGECHSMKSLDVTGWDTSNVTDVTSMFTRCRAMTEMIGSGGLNFSKVTSFNSMCEGWDSMPYIDVTNWNCGSGTTFDQMFAWALKLEKLEGLKNWDVSNATSMARMFYASVGLKEIDVTGWDVSNVKAINGFICSQNQNKGDMQLEKAIGFNTWNLASVEHIGSMFYGCGKLTEVDLSGWNMPNMTSATHMFADCYNLKNVNFTGWNTPSWRIMDAMFNNCEAMESIDVSSFDTANVTEFSQVFEACYSLKEIIGLDKWVTTSGHDYAEMFSGCTSLTKLDLSTFDTRNANKDYKYHGNLTNEMFLYMIRNVPKLEQITFGPYFSFDGDGTAPAGFVFQMPASGVAGWDGKWYNAETGVGYLPSEIPEKTAATYVAVKPANP